MSSMSRKQIEMLVRIGLIHFSKKILENPLKTKYCLSPMQSGEFILFRILRWLFTLRNEYSLDFLLLLGQAKSKRYY
jgi:hypothetical protein